MTLDELASAIRHEHLRCEKSYADAVEAAIRAGELLIEAKEQVGHGGWLPWLANHFAGSVRTAQGYMRIARHPEDARRVSHLGVGAALRALQGETPRGREWAQAAAVLDCDQGDERQRALACAK